ncbi:MAG: NAD(P)H-hydrate dehydratase [Sporolactobacillus sp.]
MHVVSREEMQTIDQYTIKTIGLGGPILMENAGRAIETALVKFLKAKDKIVIVVGKGNNGGDGFVVSRLLLDRDYHSTTWLLPETDAIQGDARVHMDAFLASGGTLHDIKGDPGHFVRELENADVIIDALLGTGFHGIPYADYGQVIDQMNQAQAKIVSVDLPSGVPANGESFSHSAVLASVTLTLVCPKMAQFVQPAAKSFGRTEVLDIGIPKRSIQACHVQRSIWSKEDVLRTLPKRNPFSHKGSNGKGLVIAGSQPMPGAAFFAAKAALRSGIGLLRISVPDEIKPIVASLLPEVMHQSRGAIDFQGLNGIAIGPGLGRGQDMAEYVLRVLETDVPCVIDADGLYHLAGMLDRLKAQRKTVILSPHSGEMARLIGGSVRDVENNRFEVSQMFAKEYGVYLILKGRNTIITAPDGSQVINLSGNAALAKGGSGDVLTGILLGLLLQHKNVIDALCNAVYLHGALADDLVQTGHSQLDVLATDLIEQIPPVLHRLYLEAETFA